MEEDSSWSTAFNEVDALKPKPPLKLLATTANGLFKIWESPCPSKDGKRFCSHKFWQITNRDLNRYQTYSNHHGSEMISSASNKSKTFPKNFLWNCWEFKSTWNLSSVSQYWPISLLYMMSKFFEFVMNKKYANDLRKNKLLNDKQNGFRPAWLNS